MKRNEIIRLIKGNEAEVLADLLSELGFTIKFEESNYEDSRTGEKSMSKFYRGLEDVRNSR